ncbi:NAD-dependent epimerase/dehydratase family protein [Candidatus Pacearchaeota archaeon]|jgi:nucleoside-diphosphate-sugar epimerase|nr:NAD-dependent epimerase/dehydratase family protein [Candidatus Pacearchaeota archaeon]
MKYKKSLENKTILITGGCGFIGTNLAHKLSNYNPKEIIIVDSLVKGLGGDVNNLQERSGKIALYTGNDWDIKNIEKIKPLIAKSDYIFNLAGSTKHNPLEEKNISFDLNANLTSHIYFLEACRQVLQEKKDKSLSIVFVGTRDQYGKLKLKNLPVKENFLPRTFTDYQSINKITAEAYHFLFYSSLKESGFPNIQVNSARIVNTYGPYQDLNCGAVIPTFIKKILNNCPIELWGGGDVLRDFNHVDDVNNALILLATSKKSDVYNLGCCIGKKGMSNPIGGNLKSLKDIAYLIKDIAKKGEIKEIPYPLERKNIEPGHCCSDITKIYNEFGWIPQINLRDGLEKTLQFYN